MTRHSNGWAPLGKRVLARLITEEVSRGGIVVASDYHNRDRLEAWTLEVLAVSSSGERGGYEPGHIVRALRHACVAINEAEKLYTVHTRDIIAMKVAT